MRWTRFAVYLYSYWKLQLLVIVLGFISTPLALTIPYLTKLIIDKAYENKDFKLFLLLAVVGGCVFIVNSLINSLSSYLSRRINRKVNFDISKDLFRHLQSLSLRFYNNHSTGENIYRMQSDVRAVGDFVCNVIPQIITLIPRFICILIIVFYLNWKLALLATLLVPFTYIQPYFFSKWLKDIASRSILRGQGIFMELQEVFSRIRLVKALSREGYEVRKFEESLNKQLEIELKNIKVSQLGNFVNAVFQKTISGIIAFYGGYQVIQGTMTLGSLMAIMIYLGQFVGYLKSIGGLYQTITVNSVVRQRLAEMFDTQPDIVDADDAVAYHIKSGAIEFQGVYFGYKQDDPVLRGISFSIKPRAKVALVGLSGTGKTTILSLLLRLYQQQQGVISIDGVDIRKIKLESLKSQVSVALQEPLLWNDTVAYNILYGAEGAGREDMLKAAALAQAHDFIMCLPRQYDTIIGEGACKISEGQKQRIAVARALARKSHILILDEALSSLDSETEDKIITAILSQRRDSTVIIVSHRLSAVQKMETVYFLSQESTVESGTHSELLEKNVSYRELFTGQIMT